MSMRSLNFISFFILVIQGCSSVDHKNLPLAQIPIPIPEERATRLSDFVNKIEYAILPEGTKVARIDEAQKLDDLYFLADYEITRGISIVNENLKQATNIHNFGEGPGEYLTFLDFTINKSKKTVDLLSLNKLIRYNFEGKFIEEIKLPGIISKIQHIEGDNYLLYKPKALHENFKGPDTTSILWTWNSFSNELTRIPSAIEMENIPLFNEINNLNFQNNQILFSTNFLDTIYVYSDKIELLEKRHFNSKRPNFPYSDIKNSSELVKKLNDPEVQKTYYYQLTNLLENEKHFITAIILDGKFTNLIYDKKNNKSILFSETENDVDGGYKWITPVLLEDNKLVSIIEPSYFIEHFETGEISELSPFYKIAKQLTMNSPLVMIKYSLK